MLVIGNEELEQRPKVKVGQLIDCACGKRHRLTGDDNGGTFLLFYRCKEASYLAAIKGRLLPEGTGKDG